MMTISVRLSVASDVAAAAAACSPPSAASTLPVSAATPAL
jgi:hypothetical protein